MDTTNHFTPRSETLHQEKMQLSFEIIDNAILWPIKLHSCLLERCLNKVQKVFKKY